MPDINVFKDQNEFDPVFKVDKKKKNKKNKKTDVKVGAEEVKSPNMKTVDGSDLDSLEINDSSDEELDVDKQIAEQNDENSSSAEESEEELEADRLVKL